MVTANLPAYLENLFTHFDTAYAQAASQYQASIGGVCFDCRTQLAGYAESLRATLAHTPGMPCDSTCRVLVVCGDSPDLPPFAQWAEPYFREREVEAALAATRYRLHYLHELGFWQFYDRQSDRGIQWMQTPQSLPAWDSGSPLRNFMHWHFARQGSGLVHAGTLAWKGTGMLLAGAGGSGKSGTVLAGITHGLDTVGDDYVLVSDGPVLTAQALFKTLKQDPTGFKRLGLNSQAGLSAALNWQGKHQFTLDDLVQPPACSPIEIRALCLPTITHGVSTAFERVSHKEAFLALAPSGVTQMPADRDTLFAFYARLARRLPAWRLRLGTDPQEIAHAVIAFLKNPPS